MKGQKAELSKSRDPFRGTCLGTEHVKCYFRNYQKKQATWLSSTEVRSASFRLVLHAQYIFANSVNFFVTWGLLVTIFHSTYIFCVYGMAVYWLTPQFYVCVYVPFVCRYVAPPGECYYNTMLCAIIFHCRMWYLALSLHYACIRSSSIIVIP